MLNKISSLFIDALSIGSVVGIWPRYIEPRLLKKTYLTWSLPDRHKTLKGLKILHFTDLHFNAAFSPSFLKKMTASIRNENVDLLVFTGDFLCYSILEKKEVLKEFLISLKPKLGAFCVLGNHDYASYVSRDLEGNYNIGKPIDPMAAVLKSFQFITSKRKIKKGSVSDEVKRIAMHKELMDLLKECQFQVLENSSHLLPIGLNIVGLGEYTLGRTDPKEAFAKFDPNHPGLVLVHNPDAFPEIESYPGELILAGHTHGEQIHITVPLLKQITKKLVRMENPQYTRGLYQVKNKQFYVNRGVGCHKPFRLGSIPELLVVTIV